MKTRLKESHYETPRMRDVKTWTQEAVFAVVITGLDAAAKYDFRLVSARFNGLRIAKQL